MRALIASSAIVAAMLTAAPVAVAQQNAPFCLRGSESGALSCSFQTMAQCEQSKSGAATTGICVANPRGGTTGSGNNPTPGRDGGMGQGSPSAPSGTPSPSR
jgi:hypothetical protein